MAKNDGIADGRNSESIWESQAVASLMGHEGPDGKARPASRDNPLPTLDVSEADRPIVGDQALTVGTVAVSLTVPATAKLGVLEAQTNPLRYRLTGQVPTASFGHDLAVGAENRELLTRSELLGFQAVRGERRTRA